ncbi:MAG: ABC transporter ATP-binding protein [Acidimicrobiales bacterium]
MTVLLDIQALEVEYRTRQRGKKRAVRVIDGLDLQVEAGETLGVVGESGSGKSTLAHSIVGLVTPVGGSIRFGGTELIGLKGRARKPIQQRMQMVFQNPLLSLSPRLSIGAQLHEPLQVHTDLGSAGRNERIAEWLDALELSDGITSRYPHELSGGQAQRVVLARAMTLEPDVMVFDEPTSALDVSVQAGVLNLLQRLKGQNELTYLFITHDLAVARHLSDRIAVMQAGQIVELQPTADLFERPEHPYTETLLASSLAV